MFGSRCLVSCRWMLPFCSSRIVAVLVLHHLAELGHDGDALRGIAAVVHQQADQQAVRPALADVEGEALFDRGEAAGLHDVADEIGAHLGDPAAQQPQTFRREIGADRRDHDRREDRDRDERRQQPPRPHAGAVHHDDFGIGGELVQDVSDRDHERDRRDHHDQLRDDQAGDADERQDGLALAGHQIDVAQRLGYPDRARQADRAPTGTPQRWCEKYTGRLTPSACAVPPSAEPPCTPDPTSGGPRNQADRSPRIAVCLDRSTKWLRNGKPVEHAQQTVNAKFGWRP